MIFAPLPLEGAFEIALERRADTRGFFARIYCDDEFAGAGLNTHWVQMNLSLTAEAGTLRGMHFQRPPAGEVKLVRAAKGRAHDVIVDLRAGSATYGRHAVVVLDAETRNAVYIPEGFAHGFQALLPETELIYAHSRTYAPGHEGGIHPLDPGLAIDWPLPPRHLSARDDALPALKELAPL